MNVKRIACPSCGSNFEIDDNKKHGVCEVCNSSYYLEDDIIRIEYSFANEQMKRVIANANVSLYKFNNYKKSLPLFLKLFNKYQDNQDFLYGVLLSLTHNFELKKVSYSLYNKILKYWDLYEKIGKKDNIKKHKEYIDDLKDKLNKIKEKRNKTLRIILLLIGVIVICLITLSILMLVAKPTSKKVKVIMSKIQTNSDYLKYINHSFMSCSVYNVEITDGRINVSSSCWNMLKKKKNYKFVFEYKDDVKPYIESSNCNIEEGEKPNYDCVEVKDNIDGVIKEYQVDESESDFNTIGVTKVKIIAKDSSNNELNTTIDVNISKLTVKKISLSFGGEEQRVGNTTQAYVSIEPERLSDKSVIFTSSDSNVASIDSNGLIRFNNTGSSNICVTSNYDNNYNDCEYVNVKVQCKNTYVYDLDPGKENVISANYDYCPGTYKLYAPKVLNYNDFYHFYYYTSNSIMSMNSMTVWKESSYLNDEGKKIALGDSSRIEIPSGVRQVKLVKTS